jgi:hypothetical protein
MRVGVPVSTGIDMALAVAKLRVVELYDVASTARLHGEPFDPEFVDCSVFSKFELLEDEACDEIGRFFFAGRCELLPEDVSDAKRAIGRFAKDVVILSSRPIAQVSVDSLESQTVEQLANVAGVCLPIDWEHRVRAWVCKHSPERTTARCQLMDSPEFLHMRVPPPPTSAALKRCACGNFASRADLCNKCAESGANNQRANAHLPFLEIR